MKGACKSTEFAAPGCPTGTSLPCSRSAVQRQPCHPPGCPYPFPFCFSVSLCQWASPASSGCHRQEEGHLLGRRTGREQCWSSQAREVWVRLSMLAVETMPLNDSKRGRMMILN